MAERAEDGMYVIRHDAPRRKFVANAIVAKKRLLHDIGNIVAREPTRTVAVLQEPLRPFGKKMLQTLLFALRKTFSSRKFLL